MKKALFAVLALLFVPLVVTTGCANGRMSDAELEKIVREVVERNAAVATTTFDMTMDALVDIEGDAEIDEMSISATGTGVVDSASQSMHMTMDMVTTMPGEGEIEIPVEYFLVDGWMYMSMQVPDQGEQWMKFQMPEGMWEQQSQVQQQIDMLRDADEVSYLGSEDVNGVACHVVKIVPDMESLQEMVSQMQGQMGGLEGVDLSAMDLGAMMKSMSMTQYIAEDSYLFMKTTQHIVIEITPEQLGIPEGEFERITEDVSTTMVFRNYDEPATIQLPQGALAAAQMG
ncbi:hypothetical protein ACFLUT_03870 [Chloroflexota bacterium]